MNSTSSAVCRPGLLVFYFAHILALILSGLVPFQVKAQPMISTQPQSLAVVVGSNATFSVSATGNGPLTYQWFFNVTNPVTLINTIAGNGSASYSGDGGAATNAAIWGGGLGVDNWGNVFLADSGNARIRKIDTNGIITTVVGTNGVGFSGDGGPATNAMLYEPNGVTPDGMGNLFIADDSNERIRKVDTNGIITTVAGNGGRGYSGDGWPATNAMMNIPDDVVVDASGNLFINDIGNACIRKVDTNGVITTVAGTGTNGYSGDGGPAVNAMLNIPEGVAVDNVGNLYIADTFNQRIRKVGANGIISTIAGTGAFGFSGDYIPATNSMLYFPEALTMDNAGNVLIADNYNGRIRKVDTNGIISTIAGGGSPIAIGDGGAAVNAAISQPCSVVVDSSGNVFTCDIGHRRIRKVSPANQSTLTLNQVIGACAGNYGVVISDADGSVTSSVATLIVDFPPTVQTQPKNEFAFIGQPASFSVSVSGTPPFSWQWQQNGTNLSDNGNISGSASSNLTISSVSLGNAGDYSVAVTNAFGGTVSSNAALGVLVLNPANQFVFAGGTAAFSVLLYNGGSGATTAGFAYQWRRGNQLANDIITTVAGTNVSGYSGDGGPAITAKLSFPGGVAVDNLGDVYIADSDNNRIRKVDTHGVISTVAGTGVAGFTGDGALAVNAKLYFPQEVAVDNLGNLFIADMENSRIRKVDTNGIITTVAGTALYGYSGDGGPATNASLAFPLSVTPDNLGNLYIADTQNSRIRKVNANGIITTVAGTNTTGFSGDGGPANVAVLNHPGQVALDSTGNLFIADSSNHRIRKVDTNGIITTVAGGGGAGFSGDGHAATNAQLGLPAAVAVDSIGDLFILDTGNARVRKVDTSGVIFTVAGSSGIGYSGDGGPATSATLSKPSGIALDSLGNLFIADTDNSRIRKVSEPATSALELSNVGVTNAGNYSAIVSTPYGTITSGIVSLTVVTPLINIVRDANGDVLMGVAGLPNTTSRLWTATSLAPPIAWQPLFTNTVTAPNGSWHFTDTHAPGALRFYRFSTP